ncbi:hypothetical protein [Agarilytica rhodophyticola]|uniref:hypothetical protein n=1 Tax=Agarilytica rhodophyticola TaxID=1737490 RepID=UPI000B343F60|nr:hypothetical protein [Agarilytica rhodophyticola]
MKTRYIIPVIVFSGIALFLKLNRPVSYTGQSDPISDIQVPDEPSQIGAAVTANVNQSHRKKSLNLSSSCNSLISYRTPKEKAYSVEQIRHCIDSVIKKEKAEIDALKKLILLWAHINISDALSFAKNLSEQLKPYVLPATVQIATTIDSHTVLRWIQSENLEQVFDIKQAYFRGLVDIGPQSALEDIIAISSMEASERDVILASTLEHWAEQDANQAIQWIEDKQIQNPQMADKLMQIKVTLLMKLIKQNDSVAENKILALEPSADKTLLLQSLTKHLANMDKELAIEWAQALVDPGNRQLTISAAFKYWATDDVSTDKIIDLILSESDENVRQAITNEAVQLLANRDSQELADSLFAFPEEEHPKIVGKIANAWISSDYQEAKEWVNGLPSGSTKDSAIYRIVTEGLYNFDQPEEALAMIEDISQSQVQFHARRKVFMEVARSDIDKAHEMLAEVNLSDNETRSIARAFTTQH